MSYFIEAVVECTTCGGLPTACSSLLHELISAGLRRKDLASFIERVA
jgi:hypothetical protein